MQSTRFNLHLNLLQLIIRGICIDATFNKGGILSRLQGYFSNLAHAYHAVLKEQPREFFGLRDYYRYQGISILIFYYQFFVSLIKMLYWMTESTKTMLTVPQLRHAIRRNFSGFSASDEFNPFNYFVEQFPDLDEVN